MSIQFANGLKNLIELIVSSRLDKYRQYKYTTVYTHDRKYYYSMEWTNNTSFSWSTIKHNCNGKQCHIFSGKYCPGVNSDFLKSRLFRSIWERPRFPFKIPKFTHHPLIFQSNNFKRIWIHLTFLNVSIIRVDRSIWRVAGSILQFPSC